MTTFNEKEFRIGTAEYDRDFLGYHARQPHRCG